MLAHNTLANYYTVISTLKRYHKYNITELEDLYPFEIDVYASLINKMIEEEKKASKEV